MFLTHGSSRATCFLLWRKMSMRYLSSSPEQDVKPLLRDEVLQYLNLEDGQTIVDMTFGDGLHTEAILKSNATVNVVALDRDSQAVERAKALALKYPGRVTPLHGCFSNIPKLFSSHGILFNSIDAMMVDVGCSSMQLNDATRGFSSDIDGPLDMRMGESSATTIPPVSITAHDILTRCDENDLHRILKTYGGVDSSRKIAAAVLSCRYSMQSLRYTLELRDFVKNLCPDKGNRTVKNVFYALRTFVNNEFNELNYAMLLAEVYLKKGGRLLTLTYSQLEDIVVKRHFTGNTFENNPNPVPLKYYSQEHNLNPDEIEKLRSSMWSLLTKHVITPSKNYDSEDPLVRAVKMRAAVKL